MNKRGFTLVELLASIVILGILSTVAVISYRNSISNAEMTVFETYEKSLRSAADEYYMNILKSSNIEEIKKVPKNNTTSTLKISTLINNGYIDYIANPITPEDKCTDTSIYVTRHDEGSNISFEYQVCLLCDDYISEDCE